MYNVIEFNGRVPGNDRITFLHVIDSGDFLAIVKYALDGVEQDYGVRVDLDKQAFLDQEEEGFTEELRENAMRPITACISEARIEEMIEKQGNSLRAFLKDYVKTQDESIPRSSRLLL